MLCVRELRVSKLCLDKMCIDKLCVSELRVSKLCVCGQVACELCVKVWKETAELRQEEEEDGSAQPKT